MRLLKQVSVRSIDNVHSPHVFGRRVSFYYNLDFIG